MIKHSSVWLFDFGAWAYNLLTANQVWQASCACLLEGLSTHQGRLQVLDMGVGPGVSAMAMGRAYPEAVFIGLDLSRRMLAEANGNQLRAGWPVGRLSLLRADVVRLPLADRQVDAVTGHSFLYLLPDYRPVLAGANRVLRPGGYVAFLEPRAGRPDWLWLARQGSIRLLISVTLWRFYSGWHRRFSGDSLRLALEEAGFVKATTKVTLGGFGLFGHAQKPEQNQV